LLIGSEAALSNTRPVGVPTPVPIGTVADTGEVAIPVKLLLVAAVMLSGPERRRTLRE
jgi:hypothetical protein